jgi:hypothetical protein
MLGRKSYTQEELDHAKAAIKQQMATHRALANTAASATADTKLSSALEPFSAHFFNNLMLVLDRYFVHRLRWSRARTAIHPTRSKCPATR